MSNNDSDETLERTVDRALRKLPLRRAPHTLESRVFAELERRAALPWWRHSFAHWPLPARAAFLVICIALIGFVFVGGTAAMDGLKSLSDSGSLSLSWAREAAALMASAGNLIASLTNAVPPGYLYGGLAVCAVLYAVLFGLGAAVYRTLYLQPKNGG
jgi:predicted anti-sigma-YlaC factor YlaD